METRIVFLFAGSARHSGFAKYHYADGEAPKSSIPAASTPGKQERPAVNAAQSELDLQ